MSNLYIHIPFCARKCRYCAFYSIVPTQAAIERYVDALAEEMRLRRTEPDSPVETIYFGGGTPSMLSPKDFARIADALRANWQTNDVAEWTVELNPASTTREFLRTLRDAGVNRISIGAQSFCDATLERIGRPHDAQTAVSAIMMAHDEGFDDFGFDLIANLPGVTGEEWGQTLNTALSLSPKHISVYDLIIEPGTEFGRKCHDLRTGFDDDTAMDTLNRAADFLCDAGFTRYEISNYAPPGFECKHNLAVWRGDNYIGLGPAASSRCGLRRRTNARDLDAYCAALLSGQLPPASEDETVSRNDDAEERFVYGLRLREGVSPSLFAKRHPDAAPLAMEWERRLASFETLGITERNGDRRWRLTKRGLEVCDSVISELLA